MDYQLRCRILGPAVGDFRPGLRSRDELLALIRQASAKELTPKLLQILAPRASFSNRVVRADSHADIEMWDDVFGRSIHEADGGVVRGANKAIAFFNGDCPLVCLQQEDRLAVLHAGYRCLIRESHTEPNLLHIALKDFDPLRVRAWIGLGIGPCCWVPGYQTKPEILDPSLHPDAAAIRDSLDRTMAASPGGAGQVTINLGRLATALLVSAGVPEGNIQDDGRCTCCWQQAGKPVCWSLTRAKLLGGVDGRNFAVAWLE